MMTSTEANRRRCEEIAARKAALVGPPIGAMSWELNPPVAEKPKAETCEDWDLDPSRVGR